jgi:hypothetical protein
MRLSIMQWGLLVLLLQAWLHAPKQHHAVSCLGQLAGCLYARLCRHVEWWGGRAGRSTRKSRIFALSRGLLVFPFIVACNRSAFV